MKADEAPRVVFDTNALISAAILPRSISRKAFRHALEHCRLVHSQATASELHQVINRPKFDRYFSAGEREEFLFFVARSSELLPVDAVITECPDAADNKFLELAVSAAACIIVSGDPHLRAMHPFRGITIATPGEFLRLGVEKISWQDTEIRQAIQEAEAGDFADAVEVQAVRDKWLNDAG